MFSSIFRPKPAPFILGLLIASQLAMPAITHVARATEPAAAAAPAVDAQKLQNAKDLTGWLQRTLAEKQALVAVVAREGGKDTRKHDRTGMAHTGLAVYDPRAQTWIIYNLMSKSNQPQQDQLWRSAPMDFFYGQTGYEKDALLLIPDKPTQARLYEAILNGSYKKQYVTTRYNLLSPYDTLQSMNCNKWLLFNLVAARIDNDNPADVAQAVRAGFEPGQIRLSPLENHFARQKSNVIARELPASGPIRTVTVDSLYSASSLFPTALFYSGRVLDRDTPQTNPE